MGHLPLTAKDFSRHLEQKCVSQTGHLAGDLRMCGKRGHIRSSRMILSSTRSIMCSGTNPCSKSSSATDSTNDSLIVEGMEQLNQKFILFINIF